MDERMTEMLQEQKEIQKFLAAHDFKKILAEIKDEDEQGKEKKLQKRAEDARFRKQKDTLVKKAERMRVTFDADMFILIRRKGKIYGFCGSSDGSSSLTWPLSMEQVVSSNVKLSKHKNNSLLHKSFYPRPFIRVPSDFQKKAASSTIAPSESLNIDMKDEEDDIFAFSEF
jgi:hypothetical protein